MIFTFEERPDSRQETHNPPSYTLIYKAVGEQDDGIVQAYALGATPAFVIRPSGILYRKNIQRDPDGWAQYTVTVPYGARENAASPGSYTFDFDTTGATVNIKAALKHIATYEASGLVSGDWHKGAIGVKPDGEVEGVDIVIPALRITYTFRNPAGVVDEDYARALADATGRTNENEFRGFQPGELLFAGASGSDGSEAEASVGYQFIANGNRTDLSIGDIGDIAKLGNEYIWVEFCDNVNANQAVRQPKRAHVEMVYEEIAFEDVFGWS